MNHNADSAVNNKDHHKANPQKPKIDFAVGGQAVVEGVMMRSPGFITLAVRDPEGKIKLIDQPYKSFCLRAKMLGLPIIRGVINMFEMMIVGTRMLNFSANVAIGEDATDNLNSETKSKQIFAIITFSLSIVFALGMSLFLFKFLPLLLTDFLSKQFPVLNQNYLLYNLVDGFIKTTFFVAYIGLLGLTPNLKRVFQYHGAEHKSIYTYESGKDLTVENARTMTRFHPRCGTSFILVVFFISIFIYTFVPRMPNFWANFGLRVLFLPIVAGISYEFLKWSANRKQNLFVKMLITPGLWFQRLTTREPDDTQLEIALTALKKALELEEQKAINILNFQPKAA